MKIQNKNQYNQNISKYKLLSSNAGVGSIVTTKFGTYVLISDINQWGFIHQIQEHIQTILNVQDNSAQYDSIKEKSKKLGLELVEDKRFIEFLKKEKNLQNLLCFVKIPSFSLSDQYNQVNFNDHQIQKQNPNAKLDDFIIKATHFPSWFKNQYGNLKKINEWQDLWKKNRKDNYLNFFAPPRDYYNIRNNNQNNENQILEQTNLILICPNGHLSDIPWSKYLNFKTRSISKQINNQEEHDFQFNEKNCCDQPDLKWTENKTKSDGFSSIYIECKGCGKGTGKEKENPKVNLEGIFSISPECKVEMPWQTLTNINIPIEKCTSSLDNNKVEKMSVSLVTANNVYFANTFSSLFIPNENMNDSLQKIKKQLEILYSNINNNNPIEKLNYWDTKFDKKDFKDWLEENGLYNINEDEQNKLKQDLKKIFLNDGTNQNIDYHEEYRYFEYDCFINNEKYNHELLKFQKIELPKSINKYFEKIVQVDELMVTNVQLDFSRVKPNERLINADGIVANSSTGQKIFSKKIDEVYALPVINVLGEGIFFQFKETQLDEWVGEFKEKINERLEKYNRDLNTIPQGKYHFQKITNHGIKYFLIHTFSHILMRELEFSCGYPTSSLKERLYISNNTNKMSGVLIYTSEGSDGSMGGLVSQGEPNTISNILSKALKRAINCTSDPLCWDSDGQGLYDLNLASCFSCSLVSETSCENMNLILDRKVLVDEEFGYFRDLI